MCVASLPKAQVFPGASLCLSQQSEKLWVDLAYFCYSAIATVPSNGEGGFQIAVLCSPEKLTPPQGSAAGSGLLLAESAPGFGGQWDQEDTSQCTRGSSLAARELTVPTECELAQAPGPTEVSEVVAGHFLTPAAGMLPC